MNKTPKGKESKQITFEKIPAAVDDILNRLAHIEQLLTHVQPETNLKPPVSIKDLCKFLNVTEPTIFRYRKKGLIPYFTIGSAIRFDLDKVLAALEKGKTCMTRDIKK